MGELLEPRFEVDSQARIVLVCALELTPAEARALAARLLVIADRAERQAQSDAA